MSAMTYENIEIALTLLTVIRTIRKKCKKYPRKPSKYKLYTLTVYTSGKNIFATSSQKNKTNICLTMF